MICIDEAKKNMIRHNLQWLPKDSFFHRYCSFHKTDICIAPCEACKKLLDELLKKYNILNCEM